MHNSGENKPMDKGEFLSSLDDILYNGRELIFGGGVLPFTDDGIKVKGNPVTASFNTAGKLEVYLVSFSHEGIARITESEGDFRVQSWIPDDSSEKITSLAYMPEAEVLFIGYDDGSIKAYNVSGQHLSSTLTVSPSSITTLVSHGVELYAGTEDGCLMKLGLDKRTRILNQPYEHMPLDPDDINRGSINKIIPSEDELVVHSHAVWILDKGLKEIKRFYFPNPTDTALVGDYIVVADNIAHGLTALAFKRDTNMPEHAHQFVPGQHDAPLALRGSDTVAYCSGVFLDGKPHAILGYGPDASRYYKIFDLTAPTQTQDVNNYRTVQVVKGRRLDSTFGNMVR